MLITITAPDRWGLKERNDPFQIDQSRLVTYQIKVTVLAVIYKGVHTGVETLVSDIRIDIHKAGPKGNTT